MEKLWSPKGMTIKDLLEKVDLFNISVEDDSNTQTKQKNLMKNSDGKTVIQVSDPLSAYLGPKLWDKQLSFSMHEEDDEEGINNDVMSMEEFLAENNLSLGLEKSGRSSPLSMEASPMFWENPDSPGSGEPAEKKPCIRPNVIMAPQKKVVGGGLPKGDNLFLYAESKRARMEREKEERRRKLTDEIDFAPEDLALATVPGLSFNPKERAFDMEELRPQPIIRKRKKTYVPDQRKDDKYWENRIKNNIAARRSREARRLKENQIALRAAYLEKENSLLKQELDDVEFVNTKLRAERDILKIKLARFEGAAL